MRNIYCLIFVALSGCTSIEKYSFPGGDDFSEITFETDAPNWIIDIYVSTSEVDCEGFKSAGRLFYDAQLRAGGLFGTLQKLNFIRPDENPTVTQRVPSRSVIQVKASALTNGAGIYGVCGPVTTKFNSGGSGKFKAYVGLKEGYCFLTVTELPENKRIGEVIRGCK